MIDSKPLSFHLVAFFISLMFNLQRMKWQNFQGRKLRP